MNLKKKFYHRLVHQIPLPGKGFLDKNKNKWTRKGLKGVYRLSQMIPEKNINIGDDKYFAWCTFAHILTDIVVTCLIFLCLNLKFRTGTSKLENPRNG